MTRFLMLYSGPPTPPDASHEGWRDWFSGLGDALVDRGAPMTNGVVVRADGATAEEASSLRGYGVIQAEGLSEALQLLRSHPLLAAGPAYAIEVFELPAR